MWNPFSCNCPANSLHVKKMETIVNEEWRKEVYATERTIIATYHLYCLRCGKQHDIKYARFEEKD